MTEGNVLCKNWYLLEEKKNFKPRPQNRILVPFPGSFQNFRRTPPSFLYGGPPGLPVTRFPRFPRINCFAAFTTCYIVFCFLSFDWLIALLVAMVIN